jgi:iron complex outermembrane receptor protein
MISLKHFVGDHMVYATVATGVKAGGFNGSFGAASIEDREFDSEETISYEIGAKFEGLLDGRARLNLAYFYTEFDDFQAATWDPETVMFLVDNAGKQTTQGVELDGTVLVSDNLTLTAKVTYLDAKYDDHKGANCHALADETFAPDGTCDLSGETLEFAPEWSTSVAADYVRPLSKGELYSRLSLSTRSDHITDPTRAPFATASYEIWDGSIGWRNKNWNISLWGKNLTDETYSKFDNANFFGGLFASLSGGDQNNRLLHNSYLNDPRTWGVTARYTY